MTKLMLVLAAALALGASSAAYAAGDGDQNERFSVGPQAQVLGTPNEWQGSVRNTYGFVLQVPSKHPVHKHTHPANVR